MTAKSPPPRPHYRILADEEPVGEVTSGGPSPALATGIGLGYVAADHAAVGTEIEIEIRERRFPAVIEARPLYRKST